jgi:hypothetical protein
MHSERRSSSFAAVLSVTKSSATMRTGTTLLRGCASVENVQLGGQSCVGKWGKDSIRYALELFEDSSPKLDLLRYWLRSINNTLDKYHIYVNLY